MGWLVLSGAPGAAGYNNRLQIVRHNGSAGESALMPWSDASIPASSGARVTWAAPYAYLTHNLNTASGLPVIDRAAFTQWPPTLAQTSFVEAGTPHPISGVFKDGAAYRAFGGNFAGGNTPYAITSSNGLTFYSRQLLSGSNLASMVRGENGRFLFINSTRAGQPNPFSVYVHRTDNYIDFYPITITVDGYNHTLVGAAGTSNGVWVLCFTVTGLPNAAYYSADNLTTFAVVTGLAFERVWAHGTTLYGAIGGRIYSSTDGTTWTDRGLPFGSASIAVLDLTYDGSSTFLLVGALGYAVTTTAFATYTPLPGYDFAGHTLFGAIYVDTLYPPVDPPVLTLFTLPNAVINVPYTTTLGTVADGEPPIVWSGSVTNPGGTSVYTISSATLAHTFVALGTHTVSVTVTDDLGRTSVRTTTLVVNSPFALADDTATTAYQTPVTIDVLANDSGTVSIIGLTQPANGVAAVVTGGIRYTPNALFFGTDTFTYIGSGGASTATATVTVTVNAPTVVDAPVITNATTPISADVGDAYTKTYTATGGVLPYTWSVFSAPPGLSMSSAGVHSGTFSQAGTFSVGLTVTDSQLSPKSAYATVVFNVIDPYAAVSITSAPNSPVVSERNAAFSATYAAANGQAPLTWTATGLPPGITLSSDGVASGTFSEPGTHSATVTVTDSKAPPSTASVTTAFEVAEIYTATIQGTLRLDTSDGAFAARDVYLYNYANGEKIAETVSNGTTGEWQFTQVAPGEYFVVGVAHGDDLNIPRDFDALGVITVV